VLKFISKRAILESRDKRVEGEYELTRSQLLKAIVPALTAHYERTEGHPFNPEHVYNVMKSKPKSMLISRYESLKKMGYIQ